MILDSSVLVGAPTFFETAIVLSRHLGQDARPLLLSLLDDLGAEVVPFAERHAIAATAAFLRFGRGPSPCPPQSRRLHGLFKGDDFAQTDVARA